MLIDLFIQLPDRKDCLSSPIESTAIEISSREPELHSINLEFPVIKGDGKPRPVFT